MRTHPIRIKSAAKELTLRPAGNLLEERGALRP